MLNRIKRRFSKMFIVVLLSPALLMLGIKLGNLGMELYGRLFYKYTYIQLIDTPTYGGAVKTYLQDFNSYGDNKIVSFDKIRFGRPVTIREMTDWYEKITPNTLGQTMSWPTNCMILIRKKQPLGELREIVLHEYLHCMGYHHVYNKADLMYYQLFPIDKEISIRQYARKVLEKFYE